MTYKDIIKNELYKKHWEIILIDNRSVWWEEEHWKIQWKHTNGMILFIQFFIDPMCDKMMNHIEARLTLDDYESEIASLYMSRGKFNIKLNAFIEKIENYRRTNKIKK
ncbi:hypothetical protein [Kordia sp.]|uniref:hypothetical protein n=1 Tax=Kordia sp. TaxID=1965332 RepID=UPI003B58DE0D